MNIQNVLEYLLTKIPRLNNYEVFCNTTSDSGYGVIKIKTPLIRSPFGYIDIDIERIKFYLSEDIDDYDYKDNISVYSVDFRVTNYAKATTSLVKRVNTLLDAYESKVDLDNAKLTKMEGVNDILQAKIDKLNGTYSNCIELFSRREDLPAFPILVIAGRKFNINLDTDTIDLRRFSTFNDKSDDPFPIHLAIPFLQETALYKLLIGDN